MRGLQWYPSFAKCSAATVHYQIVPKGDIGLPGSDRRRIQPETFRGLDRDVTEESGILNTNDYPLPFVRLSDNQDSVILDGSLVGRIGN